MKSKIILLLLVLTAAAVNAQNLSDCNKQVQKWESQANTNLTNKYIKKEGLGFASDDRWENIVCKPHDKRKCGICRSNYNAEDNKIKSEATMKYQDIDLAIEFAKSIIIERNDVECGIYGNDPAAS